MYVPCTFKANKARADIHRPGYLRLSSLRISSAISFGPIMNVLMAIGFVQHFDRTVKSMLATAISNNKNTREAIARIAPTRDREVRAKAA